MYTIGLSRTPTAATCISQIARNTNPGMNTDQCTLAVWMTCSSGMRLESTLDIRNSEWIEAADDFVAHVSLSQKVV
jgi:hypothetical protein